MPAQNLEETFERLYATETTARKGGDRPPETAKDTISKGPASDKEISQIVDRLYKTHTSCSNGGANLHHAEVRDTISGKPVSESDLGEIVERLYSSHTRASSGQACKSLPYAPSPGTVASPEESVAIASRLHQTPTKSTSGADCKSFEPRNPPGYGLKMYPAIEGIESRFLGGQAGADKVEEVISKMHSTQTKASQARRDSPRHLLYPERTLLMNNTERIVSYQETGALVRQNILQRREKWFN